MKEFITHERATTYITDLINVQLRRVRTQLNVGELTAMFIGASDGKLVRQFCESNQPMRAHCFEPNPRAFKTLRKAVRDSNIIFCHRDALGATDCNGWIYGDGQSASLSVDMAGTDKGHRCKISAFDTLLKRTCYGRLDFLRLNCEGGELHASLKLERVNVVAVAIHGKVLPCLDITAYNRKVALQVQFEKAGMTLCGGFNFKRNEKMPVNHVWQVWTRRKFVC